MYLLYYTFYYFRVYSFHLEKSAIKPSAVLPQHILCLPRLLIASFSLVLDLILSSFYKFTKCTVFIKSTAVDSNVLGFQ